MNTTVRLLTALLCMSNLPLLAESPPGMVIEKNACPFETCEYGTWGATQDTTLRASPDVAAATVATVKAGTKVKAITGEVHVIPTKLVVTKPRDAYKKGDVIWVFNYLGEGMFKITHKGKSSEEYLGISPYDGSAVEGCKESPDCPGELQRELQSTWWVQIKTPDGRTGWTNEPDSFAH